MVLGGTGSEQGGTGCQHDELSENIWFAWSKSSNYLIFEEGKSDYGQTDTHTDRISSCRLDPFCRRGRVKKHVRSFGRNVFWDAFLPFCRILGAFFVQTGMSQLKVEKNDLGFDSLQRAIRYWP